MGLLCIQKMFQIFEFSSWKMGAKTKVCVNIFVHCMQKYSVHFMQYLSLTHCIKYGSEHFNHTLTDCQIFTCISLSPQIWFYTNSIFENAGIPAPEIQYTTAGTGIIEIIAGLIGVSIQIRIHAIIQQLMLPLYQCCIAFYFHKNRYSSCTELKSGSDFGASLA